MPLVIIKGLNTIESWVTNHLKRTTSVTNAGKTTGNWSTFSQKPVSHHERQGTAVCVICVLRTLCSLSTVDIHSSSSSSSTLVPGRLLRNVGPFAPPVRQRLSKMLMYVQRFCLDMQPSGWDPWSVYSSFVDTFDSFPIS